MEYWTLGGDRLAGLLRWAARTHARRWLGRGRVLGPSAGVHWCFFRARFGRVVSSVLPEGPL